MWATWVHNKKIYIFSFWKQEIPSKRIVAQLFGLKNILENMLNLSELKTNIHSVHFY